MSTVVNTSVHPIDLSDGRTLAPGERGEKVDTKHPHQRQLVVDGLLRVDEGTTSRKRQPDKHVKEAATSDESADDQQRSNP